MITCCSMNCPFIKNCKEYNFLVDRTGGCQTQKSFINSALQLVIADKVNKTEKVSKNLKTFNIILESEPAIDSIKLRKLKDGSTAGNGECTVNFYFE